MPKVLSKPLPGNSPEEIEERLGFYELLLSIPNQSGPLLINSITAGWQNFTKASFAWLWMYNEFGSSSRWEIIAVSPNADASWLPKNLTITDGSCMAELAWISEEPVKVAKLSDTFISPTGTKYFVSCKKELEALGVQAFVAVPLLCPISTQSNARSAPMRAVVCLHYPDAAKIPTHPNRNLLLLGRLTGLKITAAFEASKKLALLDLNDLSERHLTRSTNRPDLVRREYCDQLLPIITKFVGAEWASVYYRDHRTNHETVSCIASTGLYDSEDNLIREDRLREIRYAKNEGITGTVFATGVPVIAKIGDKLHKVPPRFREIEPGIEVTERSWIKYPILKEDDGKSPIVLGVLRCVGCLPFIAGSRPGNFTQQQVQILDFISRQIAPVLETFEKQEARETQIAIVRHDIGHPIIALQDHLALIGRYLMQHDCIDPEAVSRNRQMLQRATGLSDDAFERWLAEDSAQQIRFELTNLFVQQQLLDQIGEELHHTDFLHYDPKKIHFVSEILAPIRAIYAELAEQRNQMRIRFDIFDGRQFPPIYLDRVQIQRVLVNLLMNAIKYGKSGTVINVFPVEIRDNFGVVVSNEGEGIPEEDRKRVFEARYRTAWAEKIAGGAGLGLKVSRAIMELHGGTLTIRNRVSPTEFLMLFPNQLKYSPYSRSKQL